MDIREIFNKVRQIDEGATVSVTATADSSQEVADLMKLFQNAGVEAPKDMHIDMPMAHDALHTDMDSHDEPSCGCGESPCGCGEGVEEAEWDNSPEEEYKDDNFMVHDMGDDMHRKKDRRAIRTVNPALEDIAENLKTAWNAKKLGEAKGICNECGKESYTTLSEAELEEAHGNSKEYDKCWKGYERVPGTTRGEKGSCRKKDS